MKEGRFIAAIKKMRTGSNPLGPPTTLNLTINLKFVMSFVVKSNITLVGKLLWNKWNKTH